MAFLDTRMPVRLIFVNVLLSALFIVDPCGGFAFVPSGPKGPHSRLVSTASAGRSLFSRNTHRQQPGVAVAADAATSTTSLYLFDFFKSPEPDVKSEAAPSSASVEPKAPVTDEEPDLVEKIFSVFFGKPEETPLGLKRFGRSDFPEQYPATVDEWADPLEGDDREVALLRPLLKNTNLERRGLRLAYRADRDGWSAAAFHRAVDKRGPSLVVLTTDRGQVVGGYNPKGWVSYGEARGSIAAFLFVRNQDGSYTKLRKVGGPALAQLDYPESGPSFGADALVVPLAADRPRLARSKLGSYYERFPDGANSLFGGSAAVQLKDFRVYQGVYADGEFVPFTDAEPFALY